MRFLSVHGADATGAVRPSRVDGFTLVESCIAIVIVAVMGVAAMTVAGNSARARLAQQESSRGQDLARALLTEIVQNAYEQPGVTTTMLGPEAGEIRSAFNDVDDFNGWSESPPIDSAGAAIPGFSGWTRSVVVEWVMPDSAIATLVSSGTETGLKRITVTVTSPTGKKSTAVGLRSKFGLYDKVQGASATYTSRVGISLRVGNDVTTTISGGVNPVNQAP